MSVLDRARTPYDEKIYSGEWRSWRDPEIPEWIDPIGVLFGRHRGTLVDSKPAIIADGRSVTYAELKKLIAQYCAGLASIGLEPESRLLLFGTDSLDYVTMWLAAVRRGAVPVVVSDLYKQRELLYFLADTAVRALFIDGEQVPKLVEVARDIPRSLKTIVVRGEVSPDVAHHFPYQTVVDLPAIVASGADAGEPYRRHANDVTYMFYSGGTTGTAKGITHLAHDFMLVPERHGRFWEYSAADVVFATSKKYFTHGLWPGLLIPLYWGATIVLERRPPTPDVVLANLRDYRVTKFITVPTVLKNVIELLMQTKEQANTPALNFVASASEKMPPEIFERFQTLTGVELFELDRQLGNHLRMDCQPAESIQARQPRQAGVRSRSASDRPGWTGRHRTEYSRRGVDSQPHRVLLLLAQVREIARDLRRRMDAYRRPFAIRRGRLLLVQRPRQRFVQGQRAMGVADRDRGGADRPCVDP